MDLLDSKIIYAGSLTNNSGKMIVSDPAYNFDEKKYATSEWNLNYYVPNTRRGQWNCWISQHTYEESGKRNAAMYVIHASVIDRFNDPVDSSLKWQKVSMVGVDSGQLGVFDANVYYGGNEMWYNKVTKTISKNPLKAMVNSEYMITETGFGDGMYDLYTLTKKNKIVGIRVDFIDDVILKSQ